MSPARLRLAVAASSITGVTAVLAAAALAGTSGTAFGETAPYGTASPTASTSPSPTASSTPAPAASPAPEAEAKVDDIVSKLPASVSDADKAIINAALDNAAKAFATLGLTPAQQVAALDLVAKVTQAAATDTGLTQAQKLAAINATARIADDLVKLPLAQQQTILAGVQSGLLAAAANITDQATQNAVTDTVAQAIAVLSANGQTDVLTSDVVSRLVTVTAGAVAGKTSTGSTAGVTSSAKPSDDGSVRFEFAGLKPGSTAVIILNVTDGRISAALRKMYGDRIVAAALDASGRGTLVLTGTVDENGRLVLTAPGSAIGATDAQQAQTALGKTVLGVVGTSASGASAVFATAADGKPVTPTVTSTTPVVSYRKAAVLGGTAQPGTVVQLLGRTHTGAYRILRTATVGSSGRYSFTVFPDVNMRFVVRSVLGATSSESLSTVVNVRPVVSQAVTRTATRTYRFSGRVGGVPAGTAVSVFLNTAKGSTLVGRAVTTATGAWTLTRTFTGTGVFNTFARAAATGGTSVGTSPVSVLTIR
jgi:hypothetical protein